MNVGFFIWSEQENTYLSTDKTLEINNYSKKFAYQKSNLVLYQISCKLFGVERKDMLIMKLVLPGSMIKKLQRNLMFGSEYKSLKMWHGVIPTSSCFKTYLKLF